MSEPNENYDPIKTWNDIEALLAVPDDFESLKHLAHNALKPRHREDGEWWALGELIHGDDVLDGNWVDGGYIAAAKPALVASLVHAVEGVRRLVRNEIEFGDEFDYTDVAALSPLFRQDPESSEESE